jgi:hypothetical protein
VSQLALAFALTLAGCGSSPDDPHAVPDDPAPCVSPASGGYTYRYNVSGIACGVLRSTTPDVQLLCDGASCLTTDCDMASGGVTKIYDRNDASAGNPSGWLDLDTTGCG